MLELISVCHTARRGAKETRPELEQVSFNAPAQHLMLVAGPPDSGRERLAEIVAGLRPPGAGALLLHGVDVAREARAPNQIGYVPARDDCLPRHLTVRECVMSALFLRVAGQSKEERVSRASHLLAGVGLETVAQQRVEKLTAPQARRLKLAVALVSDPVLVVCDGFTDGVEVKAERELAALLRFVVGDHPQRMVINVSQNLANVNAYDTVLILHEGRVCFHGPGRAVTHYFTITGTDELFARLAKRPAQRWSDSWARHRESYYQAFKLGGEAEGLAAAGDEDADAVGAAPAAAEPAAMESKPAPAVAPLPTPVSQAGHLALRSWTQMRRGRSGWMVRAGALVGGCALVSALSIPNFDGITTVLAGGDEGKAVAAEVVWPAGYVTIIALLLQIACLLGLGVVNGADEVAGERANLEREHAGGVGPGAWLLGRLAFVLPWTLMQSVVLGLLFHLTAWGKLGAGGPRVLLLILTCAAFSVLCMGVSAHCRTPGQARSVCWMLAFLNVLLSGALLGLPKILGSLLHPLAAGYFAWAGSFSTFQGSPIYEAALKMGTTAPIQPATAMVGLGVHLIAALVLLMMGLRRRLP